MNRLRRQLSWLADQFQNNGQLKRASYYRRLTGLTYKQPDQLDWFWNEYRRGLASIQTARRKRTTT